jgi:hypothetical protein
MIIRTNVKNRILLREDLEFESCELGSIQSAVHSSKETGRRSSVVSLGEPEGLSFQSQALASASARDGRERHSRVHHYAIQGLYLKGQRGDRFNLHQWRVSTRC